MGKIGIGKIIAGVLSMAAIIGLFTGVQDRFDGRYETKEAGAQVRQVVEQNKVDLQIHKLEEYLKSIKQAIWSLQDRLDKKPTDLKSKSELRKVEDEKAQVEKQLEKLRSK